MKHMAVSWTQPLHEMPGLMAYMRILHMTDADHAKDPNKVLELLNKVRPS